MNKKTNNSNNNNTNNYAENRMYFICSFVRIMRICGQAPIRSVFPYKICIYSRKQIDPI